MPRKAKDKEEIVEENNITKTKKSSNGSPKSATPTKAISKKETQKKSANTKTVKSKKTSNGSSKSATPTKAISKKETQKKSANVKTESKKNTRKKKEFLAEYYDLPFNYNKTVVKLLAQTPETLFVYWEISDDDRKKYIEDYGDNFFETTTPILKIHNKTKNYTFEIEINDFANCWYIHVNDSMCDYQIELDRKYKNTNDFVYISSSNDIISPNNHILFEQNLSTVKFKNVKTNVTKDIAINNSYKNIYDVKYMYELLYKNEDLEFISNPSSTFK